jgi:hypothetical protein
MNCKGRGRKLSWSHLRYYPGIYLEGLRKITKNLSHNSRSPGRDLKPSPSEYNAGVLPTTTAFLPFFLAVCITNSEGIAVEQSCSYHYTWNKRNGWGDYREQGKIGEMDID